jgi:signal transduction histidine kinase
MTIANRWAPSPALLLIIWLITLLVFVGFSVSAGVRRAADELDATGRTLHRLISQRVAQHDAHLTSLVALANAATPAPDGAIKQVAAGITRFYPRISDISLVRLGGAPDTPRVERLVSISADGAGLAGNASAIVAQKPGEVRSYVLDTRRDHYLLAKPVAGRDLAFIVEINAGLLLEPEERPAWAEVALLLDGRPVLERLSDSAVEASSLLPRPAFAKVIDSESQPLLLRVDRPLSLAEIVRPQPLVIFALAFFLGLLLFQFAWRQRAVARASQAAAFEAERRARLREHETRLAHASRVNAMGELASGMAHELTQPLTALLSQSQAALRLASAPAPDPAMIFQALDANVREARRAGAMIKRIRDYISNKPPQPVHIALNKIVADIAALMSADLEKRGIRLSLTLSPQGPEAVVDAVEMEQVLHNLIRNAVDALEVAGTPGPCIEVETDCLDGEAVIVIRDNGPGIPDEISARLFEPFFTSKPEGMGLGLSLCETLVARVEGRIDVGAAPSGGACFIIALPLVRTSLRAAE